MENNTDKKRGVVSKDILLAYGVQFGHKTFSWNPAMKPFIYGEKDKTHIIDLNKTLASLGWAYTATKKIALNGGTFLFVGTNRQSEETIKLNAERAGVYYVNHRWLGGTLTNFKTIKKSVAKLKNLEKLANNGFAGYTKKEAAKFQRELDKLDKSLGGIKFMRNLPDAIFVTSVKDEVIAIKEANKLNIPVIGIVDTNANPRSVKFPIFANDDANKSVSLITTVLADAICSEKNKEGEKSQIIVGVEKENIQVLGVMKKAHDFMSRNDENNRFSNRKRSFDNNRTGNYQDKKPFIKDEKSKIETKTEEKKEDVTPIVNKSMTIKEIKEILDNKKIAYKSSMKKDELLALLSN